MIYFENFLIMILILLIIIKTIKFITQIIIFLILKILIIIQIIIFLIVIILKLKIFIIQIVAGSRRDVIGDDGGFILCLPDEVCVCVGKDHKIIIKIQESSPSIIVVTPKRGARRRGNPPREQGFMLGF